MITTTTYRQRRRLAQQQHALICASLILDDEPGITFDALFARMRQRFPGTAWLPGFADRLAWLFRLPAAEREERCFGRDGVLVYGGAGIESIPIARTETHGDDRGPVDAACEINF